MNLLAALPNLLNRLGGNNTAPAVTITFTPQLPAQVRAYIASQNADSPFTLTVTGGNGSRLTFTAPSGQTFQATVNPPLPVGTQLQLSAADALPNQQQTTLPLQARIVHVPVTNGSPQPVVASSTPIPVNGTPQPHTTPPAQPATPVLTFVPEATSPQVLKSAITTAILQQIPVQQPTTPNAPQPLPVPAGPVAATLSAALPPVFLNQPLTLIPTGPLQANGTQPATLTPQTPALVPPQQPSQATTQPLPRSLPITLNLGVELPPNQPQPAVLFPPAPTAQTTPQSTPQPVLMLTGPSTAVPIHPATPVTLPQTPTTSQPQVQVQQATSQQAPQSVTQQPAPVPIAARILPPQPGQTAGTQTALLASGATITLQSQQPLPTGSLVIVTDIPINPTAAVQRVLSSEGQPQQQQTNTAQQGNQPPGTAAPTATQTRQAVLAPGMVIQGTITGQNEQSQPLLTLTAPANLAGQQAALNLTNPTALLPVGAGLTVRIDTALAATILGLSLPSQTQAAYTVGTIGARWEGLQQGLQALQQQSPIQAANLRASLPQLSNLLPGLIAFTNALRTNDPEKALDREASRILRAMGIDLSSDISQLSQLQQRPSPHAENQWRGTLFPYVEAAGEDPRQGGFFWRREKQDNPRAATSTRFVVEVEMSQMGAMQLDGLVTYPEIWLKLRRTTASEEGFTENLQALVGQLLQSYGLSGGIAVETTPKFPVNPRAELLAETDNPLPTTA